MIQRSATFLFLALLLTVGATQVQAQKNFKPGYIVRPEGDTLRGEIDQRGPQRMASICVFRPSADAAATEYKPSMLKAYGLKDGAQYEGWQLPAVFIPASTVTTTLTPSAPPTEGFLQVLARGRATLYAMPGNDAFGRFFYKQGEKSLTELVQIKQFVEVKENLAGQVITKRVEARDYPFRKELATAFADCAEVLPLINSAELTDSRLVKLFTVYNNCSAAAPVPVMSAPRTTRRQWSFMAGAQQGSLEFSDRGTMSLKSGWGAVYGLGLYLNPARFNSNLGFRLEALYQSQAYGVQYKRTHPVTGNSVSHDAQISQSTLRLLVMLRYTLPGRKLRPYLQGGLEVAFALKQQARITASDDVPVGIPTASSRELDLRGYGLGPILGLGLQFPLGESNSLFLEGRYNQQLGSTARDINTLNSPTTLSLLLGFSLGRLY
ncbi:hypothetical protein GCM10023185_30210 [Hymenobacter saemangeumensis]|uniref:Outer membrane protein beta-barrel domain-containing protein n=1 Tax=Hymenobacter saemangeumensis TaxID=1084522 RepID=A0ABP8IM28_9BACT